MKFKFSALLATVTMLAACGGGGSSSAPPIAGPSPTPAPTPTPSPSPSPTPSFSYIPPAAQTGSFNYTETACANGVSVIGFGAPATQSLALGFDAIREEFRILGDGVDEIFGPQDNRNANSAGTRIQYTKFLPTRRLTITFELVDQDDNQLTRFAAGFTTNLGISPEQRFDRCIFGARTQPGDRPAGVVRYGRINAGGIGAAAIPNAQGAGNFTIAVRSVADGGQNVINFNPASDTVSISLQLTMERPFADNTPPETVNLGTISGTLSVNAQTGRFEGLLNSDRITTGEIQVAGYIFGPQASELAFVIGVNGKVQEGFDVSVSATTFLSSN